MSLRMMGGLGLSVRIHFRKLAKGEPTSLKCCLFLLESRGEDVFVFSFHLLLLLSHFSRVRLCAAP